MKLSAARRLFRIALLAVVCLGTGAVAAQDPAEDKNPYKGLSLADLGNVSVTTQSKQPEQVWNTPAAISVLTREDIRRAGVTSLPDALRLIPGVEVARLNGSRNWAVGIRGFGDQLSKGVLVLIDGRSVYTPLFAGVFWTIHHVMIDNIERIEVIRGPGGTIWGANAVNGVINIITRSAADTEGGMIALGGGSTDQATADFRYGRRVSPDYSYRIYGTGFLRGPQEHFTGVPYDDSRLGQLGTRHDWTLGRDQVVFKADIYRASLGDARNLSLFTPPSIVRSYRNTDAGGGNIMANWTRALANDSHVMLQGFWERSWRTGSNFAETRDTFDLDFLHRLPTWSRHAVTYGMGIQVSPGRSRVVVPTLRFDPLSRTHVVYSGFLQDAITLVPQKVSLTVGSKLEHNHYTGFEYQPSARLLITPNKTNSFWLSAARAVRTPSRVDTEINVNVLASTAPVTWIEFIGKPDIRSERLISYEVGYRTLPHPSFYIDFSFFVNQHRDVVAVSDPRMFPRAVPAPPHTVTQLQLVNGVRGRSAGVEIAPNWRPTGWWQGKGAFSYLNLDLRNAPFLANPLTRDTLEGSSPRRQVVLQSQFNLPHRFEFDQVYRYVSALPAQRVPAYHTADLRLGWQPHQRVELSLVGQNLLQPHHTEFGIDPPPNVAIKRGVYGKLVWRSR